MRFLIISHVPHKLYEKQFFGYAPYVREMNIWLKYVDKLEVVAPLSLKTLEVIDLNYEHKFIKFNRIPALAFLSFKSIFFSLLKLPGIFITIFKAMRQADHIHLRCPGNIGLLGCLVQLCFPSKPKTAKYAGNWDPKAKQPVSYKLQKWILSQPFLTRNMQVLVYGAWPHQSKNIKPFFTATFKDSEKTPVTLRDYTEALQMLFVGSLVAGKRPLYAIQIVEGLIKSGITVRLDLFGDGVLRPELEAYVKENGLEPWVVFHGNQDKDVIKTHYKTAHFLILASQSEGWPKAVAEAMFFGCIPIATSVSCVPYMLGDGTKGILIDTDLQAAITQITAALQDAMGLKQMSELASHWSQQYTLDVFEDAIKKLLE
ncbi:glycosyltransferase family 4 protein [Siansivirga zeaxanthinifaciens]|uniref:Glycosyl transferase n=1 Tax=Siansivirga zeaxanthinifaciens CC-SAMT-1 TaxID=1454006 RepID=A0A0C5WF11_9FLAO|nr:glycosyltransferase [Siansivirga zeaxanthinifaciens]AJR03794.1 glycosyl transferase [Siansivirga zeaxanthinifaciens CC-SAMT-1]